MSKMVLPLLLLGYSLLSANLTHGQVEEASIQTSAGSKESDIRLLGAREKRNLPSMESSTETSMESSTFEGETRVKRDEDDDTPLHPDYELEKSDVHSALASAMLNESMAAHQQNSSNEAGNSGSSSAEHNNVEAEHSGELHGDGVDQHHLHEHQHHVHQHVHVHGQHPSEGEEHSSTHPTDAEHAQHVGEVPDHSISPVTMPPTSATSTTSSRKKREPEEHNPEKEPFGADVDTAGLDGMEQSTPVGEGQRLVRAIGIGHRARTQSVQKSQQQAGRGPKSDGTD